MSPLHESPELEKSQYNTSPNDSDFDKQPKGRLSEDDGIVDNVGVGQQNELHRSLKGRHMQMIAIGGAIGSGLFIGSGPSFVAGGPAAVIIGFLAIGVMIYLMMQALAELAVMYPINGAFTMYICRFVDPSFGFACAWEYAISWLTVLPFEISAACNIIHYWPGSQGINNAAWITPLLVALIAIQYFGVRGYGEVEFVLSIIKITACIGFSILGIIINVGGVPTDDRGYIGNKYFNLPNADPPVVMGFKNGFHGFCSVFVNAAFAYTGTELTGLAAAEAANPAKEIPRASKQVVWRILVFYVVNLTLVGLDVPAQASILTGDGPESRFSPFVIAIKLAGIEALPSIFNAVILLAVMSVANSCMFGSTRTVQALAANGMAPKILAYVDRKGRPTAVIILQLLFGLLAYINLADNGGTIFDWLLALSGITVLFVFGSIAIAHIRFRMAWAHNGHSLDELPFRAVFGVWGSWICLLINVIALIASFYTALYPLGGTYLSAENFFMSYLAAPLLLFLYCCWKVYSWFVHPEHRPLYVRIKDIDIYSGMRETQRRVSGVDVSDEQRRSSISEMEGGKGRKGVKGWMMAGVRNLI
ncbi:AAT family amino acid transporter [Hortaea werneckii]|nr:AAT family amino acid transporter [Hortaea werneckii]KAI6879400.1 AAT family amino acid transporter [Hortaea werneckii]KAI6987334.1 AAT family amino acid transporter [Hortaea werneckii]KAI7140830.1 AAT family amino acid transporter [Hortaea werneckii]KAI7168405.1 AAT family amino acid transporter [Hortaea werneckii]